MSESFDPYYAWLGIPPAEQPPDHYRLLGVQRFESNSGVIANAADRQMAFVQTFKTGKHSSDSQRLLNEISTARLTLLNPTKKAEYDARLTAAAASLAPRAPAPPDPFASPTAFGAPAAAPAENAWLDGALPSLPAASAARVSDRPRPSAGGPWLKLVLIVLGGAFGIGCGLLVVSLVTSARGRPERTDVARLEPASSAAPAATLTPTSSATPAVPPATPVTTPAVATSAETEATEDDEPSAMETPPGSDRPRRVVAASPAATAELAPTPVGTSGASTSSSPAVVAPPPSLPVPQPKAGEAYTSVLGTKFVWCPPGEFAMGSPANEEGRDASREKEHEVRLTKGFWLACHETTQAEFELVMGVNRSHFSPSGPGAASVAGLDTGRFPADSVSWFDAEEFCKKLAARDGLPYRLPTEAEWEYACRAGRRTPFSFGRVCDGTEANMNGTKPYGTAASGPNLARTTTVGSYSPNAWGLYDMHGNVCEWCADFFGDIPAGRAVDPTGPDSGKYRIFRGGSWADDGNGCRAARRGRSLKGPRDHIRGLRVALDASAAAS